MDGVKKVANRGKSHPSSAQHRVLQKSTTLNRRFVKRPVAAPRVLTRAEKERETLARRRALAEKMERDGRLAQLKRVQGGVKLQPLATKRTEVKVTPKKTVAEAAASRSVTNPVVATAKARVAARQAGAPRQLSAQEMKDRAIQQALRRVATSGGEGEEQISGAITKKRGSWRKRKFFAALAMSVVSIALLGYLVHLNLPDLSVRVAAMQSGIESAYPAYVPKGYRMDGLVAENGGRIEVNFVHENGYSFVLRQEKSSWDSAALQSQFVELEWGEDFEVVREQGLTIYVSGSDAVWMNGGVFYYIDDGAKNLTKQQLHDIAVSL